MSQMLQDIEGLISPVLEGENVELVDLTYQKGPGGWVLCFYLDKPGGINLTDCENWSRQFGSLLEQTDLIPQAYNLEVSSPGLARPLKKLKDFQKFSGERVQVKLFASLDGQKNFRGVLLGADETSVKIREESNNREIKLPRAQIAKTNLDPKFEI